METINKMCGKMENYLKDKIADYGKFVDHLSQNADDYAIGAMAVAGFLTGCAGLTNLVVNSVAYAVDGNDMTDAIVPVLKGGVYLCASLGSFWWAGKTIEEMEENSETNHTSEVENALENIVEEGE